MKLLVNISNIAGGNRLSWKVWLASILFAIPIISTIREFTYSGRPPLNTDAAFYEHAGWFLLNGGIPYIDMWDPKPPLNFLVTGFAAVLGDGNMLLTHSINVVLTALAAAGACLFIALITFELTEDRMASVAAGIFPMLFPYFHYLPAFGYRPKYFLLFFGFLGIYLVIRNRYFSAALSAGLSIGFWQFGVVFAIITFGITVIEYRDAGDLSRIYYVIAGFGLAAAVILLPVVVWGAMEEMLIETIYASVVTTNDKPLVMRIGLWIFRMGITNVAVGFATFGLLVGVMRQDFRWWWVYFGVAVGAVQIFLLDFEGYDDMYLLFIFLSFGIGLLVCYVEGRSRSVALGAVVITLVTSVILLGGTGVVFDPAPPAIPERTTIEEGSESVFKNSLGIVKSTITGTETDTRQGGLEETLSPPYEKSYMITIFWEKMKPETCHYRVGAMHQSWIEQIDKPYDEPKCGQI
jgi:hypothetical protein